MKFAAKVAMLSLAVLAVLVIVHVLFLSDPLSAPHVPAARARPAVHASEHVASATTRPSTAPRDPLDLLVDDPLEHRLLAEMAMPLSAASKALVGARMERRRAFGSPLVTSPQHACLSGFVASGSTQLQQQQQQQQNSRDVKDNDDGDIVNSKYRAADQQRRQRADDALCTGTVEEAIQRFEESDADAALACSDPIPAKTPGMCLCADALLAFVSCARENRYEENPWARQRRSWMMNTPPQQQQQASTQSVSCESVCASARSKSGAQLPSSFAVSLFLSPFAASPLRGVDSWPRAQLNELAAAAGAASGSVVDAVRVAEEKLELERRNALLKLLHAHDVKIPRWSAPARRSQGGESDDDEDDESSAISALLERIVGEPDDVPESLRLLADVEQAASRDAAMLRQLRRRRGSSAGAGTPTSMLFHNGGIAGGGHAGEAVDKAFDDDVRRMIREATAGKTDDSDKSKQLVPVVSLPN